MIAEFYKHFEPMVEGTMQQKSEHKVGERVLGKDPLSGHTVSVKIGRFGPVVQVGATSEVEKPRFAQLKKEQSMQTITLDEAMELFKLPRTLGKYEGSDIVIGTGRYGAYILHAKKYSSIPVTMDPISLSREEAIELIEEHRKAEKSNHLKTFAEDKELEVMNGRFGPYLKYQGNNYKLPRSVKEPTTLTYEQCMEIIEKSKK